jgi:hypothetical protein
MKMFAFGVVVGAFAYFAIDRVAGPQVAENSEARPVQPVEPITSLNLQPDRLASCPDPSRPDVAPPVLASKRDIDPRAAVERPAADQRANDTSQSPYSAPSPIRRTRIAIEDLSETEAFELCTRASMLQRQRERAKKDAEPKDAGWAYSMEQLMRQHVQSNVPADQYTKLQIECRSTFCELNMEGTGEEGRAFADKAASDITNEPWSDVTLKGQGGGSDGVTWKIQYEFYRPQTEAERRLWRQHRERR